MNDVESRSGGNRDQGSDENAYSALGVNHDSDDWDANDDACLDIVRGA